MKYHRKYTTGTCVKQQQKKYLIALQTLIYQTYCWCIHSEGELLVFGMRVTHSAALL